MCSHVAAVLCKAEAACRLGYNKPTCTSLPCSWNQSFSTKVDAALVVDINFIKPNHDKPIDLTTSTPTVRRTQVVQQYDVNTDSFYHALYQILPGACIFTSVPLPESDSGPATATHSAEPNLPNQSLTIATTRSEPDLVNGDVPIVVAAQSFDTEVTNTLSDNEAETDEDQAESSYSEPNQSCAVTQTTDAISPVNYISRCNSCTFNFTIMNVTRT